MFVTTQKIKTGVKRNGSGQFFVIAHPPSRGTNNVPSFTEIDKEPFLPRTRPLPNALDMTNGPIHRIGPFE